MKSVRKLPDSYHLSGSLDLSGNPKFVILLNLVGFLLLIFFGWLLGMYLAKIRPQDVSNSFSFSVYSLQDLMKLVLIAVGVIAVMLILHEGIHGVFFWIFTGDKPKFAFRGTYAYAAAPDWYIPRLPFLITTLAPFLLISLMGLFLLKFIPVELLLPTHLLIILNASGAVADLAVVIWLIPQPSICYAQDRGDAVSLFLPES